MERSDIMRASNDGVGRFRKGGIQAATRDTTVAPSGLYFARLQNRNISDAVKISFLKNIGRSEIDRVVS